MLRVTCYTGATPFERFTIDLSTRTHVVAKLDRVHPEPVIELAGAEPLPEFVLYPLPDQIADKVCAMYGRYGATNMPSTRYRDLVDLLLIATTNELDAMLTIRALRGEGARRGCTLPAQIEDPGPEWQASYVRIARESNLPTGLQALDGALEAAGVCLDPILAGTATGTSNPDTERWSDPALFCRRRVLRSRDRRLAEVIMATNWGELLVGQLEFYWRFHLRPRLEGLTDDEYLWAPAEPSWTVHPGPDGKIVIDGGPEPSPPPITTIAWRMVHIGVGCFAIRASTFFGDGSVPDDADMFDPRHIPADLPSTANDGLAFLDHWHQRWHDGIASLDDEALSKPLGPKGNEYADDSMAGLIVHINREVMHHGGEIGLLRDLYRARSHG